MAEHSRDVRRAIALRLEHLAVVTKQRPTLGVKLAHIRPMHFADDGVKVDAVGHGGTIGHVHNVGKSVGDPNKITQARRCGKLLNLLRQQIHTQASKIGRYCRIRPILPRQAEGRVEGSD